MLPSFNSTIETKVTYEKNYEIRLREKHKKSYKVK